MRASPTSAASSACSYDTGYRGPIAVEVPSEALHALPAREAAAAAASAAPALLHRHR